MDEVGLVEAVEDGVPCVVIQGDEVVSEARDGGGTAQCVEAIGAGGAVEEACQAQGLHVFGTAIGRGEPLLVGF